MEVLPLVFLSSFTSSLFPRHEDSDGKAMIGI
jgi:hypothetical protein